MPATPDQLHTLALEAEECVEKLSTALASVPGIDEKAVAAVGQMADALRQIAGMIGKSEPQAAPTTPSDAIGAHMAERRAAAAAPPA
jgi:hypothetical protein